MPYIVTTPTARVAVNTRDDVKVEWAEWIDIGIDPFDDDVNDEIDRLGGYSAERCRIALDAFNSANKVR